VVLSVLIIAGCNGGQSTAPTSPVPPAPVPPALVPPAAPDLSLTIGAAYGKVGSAASLSEPAGTDSSNAFGLSYTELNGFEDTLNLSMTGVPAGVTLSPIVLNDWGTVSNTQSVGVDVSPNTVPGVYAIVFTAIASDPNGNGHVSNYPMTLSVTLNLTVTAEENFSLQLGQSSFTFPSNGVEFSTTMTLVPVNGFYSNDLTLMTSAPSGVSGLTLVVPPRSGTLTNDNGITGWDGAPVSIFVNEPSPATVGIFPITFTATAPTGQSQAVTLTLTVTSLAATWEKQDGLK
jgi:hypothetical protein